MGRKSFDEDLKALPEKGGYLCLFDVDKFKIDVEIVADDSLYEAPERQDRDVQREALPLPAMYGKNLVFKTGGVDASRGPELVSLLAQGKLRTDFLITTAWWPERPGGSSAWPGFRKTRTSR